MSEDQIAALLIGPSEAKLRRHPAGIWFAGQTEIPRKFIGAAVLFLPLFVFMPNLKPHGMKADTDAVTIHLGRMSRSKKYS